MKDKKTYCFDLDGTLCTQTRREDGKPEQNPEEVYRQATPIQNRIDVVNALYDGGNKIYIDTARGTKHPDKRAQWLKITEEQLEKWGVKYHGLRLGIKLVADIYVDDMAQSDLNFFESPRSYTFELDSTQDLFKSNK